jgi:hypothetical protein
MRPSLLLTVAALVLIATAPARADRDPDLGMDRVSPPGESAPVPPESEPASATAERAAVPPADTPSPGSIGRAAFTTAVVEREPQDSISELANDRDRVFYFTELHNFAGQTLLHRWEFKDQVMGEVPFQVGGHRWRVYSTKNLEPSWLGEWTVKVVDEAGTVLSSQSFEYTQASASDEPATDSAPSEPPPAASVE